MKTFAILVALAACAHVPPAQDEAQRLICNGPRENIPDNDPALALFEGPLADRKVALAIERVNGCGPEGEPS